MKILLLFILISCNYPHSNDETQKKVRFIDSIFNRYDPRIIKRQLYILSDTTKPGGIVREYISTIDSSLLLVQDKTWYDSTEYYYTAFFINNKIALIDMRGISGKKLTFINKGYFENDSLIHEEIQDSKQGRPSILLDQYISAAEIWYPTHGDSLYWGLLKHKRKPTNVNENPIRALRTNPQRHDSIIPQVRR